MLEINILEKKYLYKVVLENVNFSIDSFGIYGLVGKNGEGKTTFFKSILGLEKYLGNCMFNNEKIIMQNIAWCPTEPQVYDELTAKEFYEFFNQLLNLKNCNEPKLFNVPENQLIREFSTGMKKKVYLNAIFQKKYPIYFLDEPFNGLDLEANYILMQFLTQKANDSIIIISSHILDILTKNCKKIVLIKNKKIKLFDKENFDSLESFIFD